MSSRILAMGEIHRGLVRRTRRDDGRVFGVFTLRDTDRMEVRFWSCFVNDPNLIEEIERLRVGEPIGVSGPFAFRINQDSVAPEIEHRLSVNAIVDTRPRKPKGKTAIRKEERVTSDEADDAPRDPEPTGDAPLDDPLPF